MNSRSKVYELAQRKAEHNHPAYSKMALLMGCGIQVRGEGSFVEDQHGIKRLALFDQYGNQSFGYSHPKIVADLKKKLDSGNVNSTKVLYEEEQILLAERLAEMTQGQLQFAYFANGGGETIDNALKLARAATSRRKFVSAKGCFHGKTFGALSAAQRPDHVALFKPLLEHFEVVPFNDLEAMAKAVDHDTAAVLLEPVQAENGVVVPNPEYLQGVRKICDAHGAYLIFDEMQTAFGRTGSFFAYQQFNAVPDILCVGKAFGGGIVPISAVVARRDAWGLLYSNPTTFGSSLGGNPLSCRAGLSVIEIASDPDFLQGVRDKGQIIEAALAVIPYQFPMLIKEVRGIGMMYGIEFHDQSLAGLALALLYERGAISTYSLYNNYVIRVQPPMTIDPTELSLGLRVVQEVLKEIEEYRVEYRDPTGVNHVSVEKIFNSSREQLFKLLKDNPRALDPFASKNWGAAPSRDSEFFGFLGGERVVWEDQIEFGHFSVSASAAPGWLWKELKRDVTLTEIAPGYTSVSISMSWDAGIGAYGPFLATRIVHYCRQRLKDLMKQVSGALSATTRLNPQEV